MMVEQGPSQMPTPSNGKEVPVSEVPDGLFLTDDDSVFRVRHTNSSNQNYIRREIISTALSSPQCRPAEYDAEGHWGPIVGGWQLSLRFPRTNFTLGEPIVATVLVRNVTTTEMDFLPLTGSGGDFPVTWSRREDNVGSRGEFTEPQGLISSLARHVRPKTQRQSLLKLDRLIPTNAPGTLAVSVRTRTYVPKRKGFIEFGSATATIRLASSLPKATNQR